MPSPGSLRYLRERLDGRPHTTQECDRALERLSGLLNTGNPHTRALALRRIDVWLEERLRSATETK